MRRRRLPGARRAALPRSSVSKSAIERRPPATSSIVPTSTRTMCRMKASASIQNSSSRPGSGSASPWASHSARRMSRSKRRARSRVGVKAVKSCVAEQRGAHCIERVGGPQGAATTARGPTSKRVANRTRRGPGSSRSATGRRAARRSRRARPAPRAPRSRCGSIELTRCASASGGSPSQLEARHLPPGVDPGVGAAGDREPHRLAEDPLQRRLELALHGRRPGWRRPAGERRSRRRRWSAVSGHEAATIDARRRFAAA